jgi:hypothetical protein
MPETPAACPPDLSSRPRRLTVERVMERCTGPSRTARRSATPTMAGSSGWSPTVWWS